MAARADLQQRRAERLRDRGRGAAHAHAVAVGRDDGEAARAERVLHGGDVLWPGAELLHEIGRLQPLVVLRRILVMQFRDQRLELILVAQRQVDAELHGVLRGRGGDRGRRIRVRGGGSQGCRQRGLAREHPGGAECCGRHLVDSHVIPLVVRNRLLDTKRVARKVWVRGWGLSTPTRLGILGRGIPMGVDSLRRLPRRRCARGAVATYFGTRMRLSGGCPAGAGLGVGRVSWPRHIS